MATQWTDHRIETTVGNLLRAGVMLSAAVVFLGATAYLWRHGSAPVDYRAFRGEPMDLRGIKGIVTNAFSRHGRGIIQMGLVLLIATPVARVAFCVWGFLEERDYLYVGFTLFVLAILLYSLIGSQ